MFNGAVVRPDPYECAKVRFQSAFEPVCDLGKRDTFPEYKTVTKLQISRVCQLILLVTTTYWQTQVIGKAFAIQLGPDEAQE